MTSNRPTIGKFLSRIGNTKSATPNLWCQIGRARTSHSRHFESESICVNVWKNDVRIKVTICLIKKEEIVTIHGHLFSERTRRIKDWIFHNSLDYISWKVSFFLSLPSSLFHFVPQEVHFTYLSLTFVFVIVSVDNLLNIFSVR